MSNDIKESLTAVADLLATIEHSGRNMVTGFNSTEELIKISIEHLKSDSRAADLFLTNAKIRYHIQEALLLLPKAAALASDIADNPDNPGGQ